jgi:hypothetical protein
MSDFFQEMIIHVTTCKMLMFNVGFHVLSRNLIKFLKYILPCYRFSKF